MAEAVEPAAPAPAHRGPGRPAISLNADDVRRAAAKLIAEKGYNATTIRDIAEALDIRKATVHHHIGSKANMLFTLISQFQLSGREIMEITGASDGDPRTRLALFTKLTLERIAEDPIVSRLLVHEFRSLEGDHLARVSEIRGEYETFLANLIAEGQEAGQFNKNLDPRICAINILLLLNSLNEWYRPEGRYGLDKIVDVELNLVLFGLSVPATS
jgi:TetR/AcrR family transcriptional regulator, cholesterol catabolism regulator